MKLTWTNTQPGVLWADGCPAVIRYAPEGNPHMPFVLTVHGKDERYLTLEGAKFGAECRLEELIEMGLAKHEDAETA